MNARDQVAQLSCSADTRYRRGDYQAAASDYSAALALAERADAGGPLELSSLLNNLGVVCKYLGAFDEAERVYLRALALTEKTLGPDHPDVATLYHNLGGLEHARGCHAAVGRSPAGP